MWQPIETAPTETTVWIWHSSGGYSLAWFSPQRNRWVLQGDAGYSGINKLDPTAWHPLPEPPPVELQ